MVNFIKKGKSKDLIVYIGDFLSVGSFRLGNTLNIQLQLAALKCKILLIVIYFSRNFMTSS